MISSHLNNGLSEMQVEQMASALIQQWLSDEWQFKWDHAKTRFGLCNYLKKTIQLSKKLYPFLNQHEIQDVIKHEIAHALAGHKNGHNQVWKKRAQEVGAEPNSSKHLEFDKQLIGAKYILQDRTGKIYRYYYRKPVRALAGLKHMWIRGEKEHTYGQLIIKKIV